MKFKKGKGVAGEQCFIVLGGYTDISHLNLSAFHIDAEYEDLDKEERFFLQAIIADNDEKPYYKMSNAIAPIDLGPCQIIPIIIPWGQKRFKARSKGAKE